MFELIHEMRRRIITAPSFTGDKVIGAILFERTMDGEVDGKPVPHGAVERGVVPFLKVDKGLEDEADGVQLMKPMPGARRAAGARAAKLGVFGTKMRSVIELANADGHRGGGRSAVRGRAPDAGHGLVPIIEPEVSIKSPERGAADAILLAEMLKALDALPDGQQVMLKLTDPGRAGPVRAVGRPSRGCCASWRCRAGSPARKRAAQLATEPRHDRQLQPRSAGGPARTAERRGVRRARLAQAIDEIHAASVA